MNAEAKAPIIASDVVVALLGYFARLAVGCMLLFVFISVIKVHLEYWQTIGAKFPAFTETMVRFSMYMLKDGWWQLPPLVAIFDFAITLLLAIRFRRHRWLSFAYAQVLLLGAIAFLLWTFAGVTVPLTGLLTETSG